MSTVSTEFRGLGLPFTFRNSIADAYDDIPVITLSDPDDALLFFNRLYFYTSLIGIHRGLHRFSFAEIEKRQGYTLVEFGNHITATVFSYYTNECVMQVTVTKDLLEKASFLLKHILSFPIHPSYTDFRRQVSACYRTGTVDKKLHELFIDEFLADYTDE